MARLKSGLSAPVVHELAPLLNRIELELDFSDALVKALEGKPELPKAAKNELDKAKAQLEAFDPSKGTPAFRKLVEEIEKDLAPLGQIAKTFTIHCVGHGHIDMNWMWSWPETVSSTHDTFASVLNFMDQYPEFTYSQSQASVYAAVQKYHPAMFEEIKKRVKEGRWEVAASHWVEGDKNLASGEALARQLLLTRNYFQEHFGLNPEDVPIDWEPDTFGHANTIPMINKDGAVKFYYSCRPGGGNGHPRVGDERPPVFYWEAPDGSRLLVNKETTWYNSYINIGDNVALPMADFAGKTGLHHWLNVHGVGNHGGGPTRTEIEHLIFLDSLPIYPNVKFSTAKRYFESVESEIESTKLEIPVLKHELNFEFTGCYTSQSLIKQANRFGENYCVEAETLAAISGMSSKKLLHEAWVNVLFNQFHDILPGSGVRETREHARGLFQEVGAITGAVKREALKKLASKIDTLALLPKTPEGEEERKRGDKANTEFVAGAGIEAGQSGFSIATGGGRKFRPFIVYNPCPWTRSEPVKVALYDTDFNPKHIVALDEQGKAHPTLYLGKEHDWAHDRLNVLFHATDVPGFGYRTYLLCDGVPTVKVAGVKALDPYTLETNLIQCEFNQTICGLSSFPFIKQKGSATESKTEDRPFGSILFNEEIGPRKSAWVLGRTPHRNARIGTALTAHTFQTFGFTENAGTGMLTEGEPIAAGANWKLEVPTLNNSSVEVTALVHPLAPRIDYEAKIDWRELGTDETFRGLLAEFYAPGTPEDFVFETPYGSVMRSQYPSDVPALRYVHAFSESEKAGFTLLQDSKYGFGIQGSHISMRLLRSSLNPDHAPEIAKTNVRYAVHFHTEKPTTAELTRLGAAWNHPFIVAPANLQSGDAPAVQGFAEVKTPGVVLTCLKQAEKGEGLVLRFAEYDGKNTEAKVEINPTLLNGRAKAECADLLERPAEGKVSLERNLLTVAVPANGIRTVLIDTAVS